MQPLAYTYEADHHCRECTIERFGGSGNFIAEGAIDNEGNMVGALFSWDEWYANDIFEGNSEAVLNCGTCHSEIDRIDLSCDSHDMGGWLYSGSDCDDTWYIRKCSQCEYREFITGAELCNKGILG